MPTETPSTSSAPVAPTSLGPAPAAGPTAASPPPGGSVILVAPPPASAVIPLPPDGDVATSGNEYRGVLPKATQFAVMGDAVKELARFSDYAAVFGRTAPSIDSIAQSFDAANQWSVIRVRTITYEAYCLQQEGLAWITVRELMNKLQPAFDLAVASDASIGVRFPALVKLFNAQRVIAKKGVATRTANRKLVAEGKPPVKGTSGKRKQRAAEKAAYLAATSTPSPAGNGTPPTNPVVVAPPAPTPPGGAAR
jgi:hypothetical protein